MIGWLCVFEIGRSGLKGSSWIVCYGRSEKMVRRIFRYRVRGPVRLLCVIPLAELPRGG